MTFQLDFSTRTRIGYGKKEVTQLDLEAGILVRCRLEIEGINKEYDVGLQIIGENGLIASFGPANRIRSFFIPRVAGRYRVVLDNTHSMFASKNVSIELVAYRKEDFKSHSENYSGVWPTEVRSSAVIRSGEVHVVDSLYSPRDWKLRYGLHVDGDDKMDIITGIQTPDNNILWRTNRIKSVSTELELPLEGIYEIYVDNSFSMFTKKRVDYHWSLKNPLQKPEPAWKAPPWAPWL